MKRSNTILPVVITIISFTFLPVNAQHCFRGKPLPKCKTFCITEFGYNHRLNRQYTHDYYFTWEAGLMRNVERQTAVGATLIFGADYEGHRFGLKPRYRRRLNNFTSLDIGAVVLFGGANNQRFPGMTSHVGLNFGDWLALTAHVEIIRLEALPFEPKQSRTAKTDVAWYAGAKLGSYPGLIAGIVGPIITLIALNQIANDFGN